MTRLPCSLGLASLLALGACLVPPTEIGSGTGDATATTQPSTDGESTSAATTMSPTGGGTTATTQTSADETTSPTTSPTTGVDTTASGTSTSESSSSGTLPECVDAEGCESNEVCSGGQCESVCPGGWGLGTWDYCLNDLGDFDTANACGGELPDYGCMNFSNPIAAVVCSTKGCVDPCGCPEPPPTGTAVVACGNITDDGINDCYLSCELGESCPDGMTCRNNLLCVHTPPDLPMYGNCAAIAGGCIDGQCLTTLATDQSMCVTTCQGPADCDPAPPGSSNAAACGDVLTPPMDNGDECYIPCNNDNDCPYIMECFNNSLCMWPPP